MTDLTNILLSSTGVTEIDAGLNVIKAIGIGACSSIGVLAIVKGIITLASGISQRDQSGFITGGLECVAGFIMAAVGIVLGVLGF